MTVALWLAQRDSRLRAIERTDREIARARLVTIEIVYAGPERGTSIEGWATITNHSEYPVHRLRVIAMDGTQPPVRWGSDHPAARALYYSLPAVLAPKEQHEVIFEHFGEIEKQLATEDVTIMFTDVSGLRWRRTGSNEPTRVPPWVE